MTRRAKNNFTQIPNLIVRAPKAFLDTYEKALLSVLFSYINTNLDDAIIEFFEKLASESSMGTSKGYLVLRSLKNKGLVTQEKRRGVRETILFLTDKAGDPGTYINEEARANIHNAEVQDKVSVRTADTHDTAKVHDAESQGKTNVRSVEFKQNDTIHDAEVKTPYYGIFKVRSTDTINKGFRIKKERLETGRVSIPLWIEINNDQISREEFKKQFLIFLKDKDLENLEYYYEQCRIMAEHRKSIGAKF